MSSPSPPGRRLAGSIADVLTRIGSTGATPWNATGHRPGALLRRAYLRALRPYLRRRAEVDLALVEALQHADRDLAALHERIEAAERELGRAADENAALQQQVAAAQEQARRAQGALALHRIETATRPAGPLHATVCTVVSSATIAHAHALGRSVERVHPGTEVLVVVTDGVHGHPDDPFSTIPLEAVVGEDASRWRERHEGVALEYALTPVVIRHALDNTDHPVIFIKQESLVVGDLRPLLDELGQASIGLTPHFLVPPEGADALERTQGVLLAGTFNGGVLLAANDASARAAMAWWEERVGEECVKAVERGRHFEQRWLDLLAATFDRVVVLRNPGANIGHWNIADRHITGSPGCLHADGAPIAVLRFSGFEVERPDVVTRYAPHRLQGGLGPLANHFLAFRHELVVNGMGAR